MSHLDGKSLEPLKDGQRISVKPSGKLKSNSGAVLIRAALDDLGIINVPAYYVSTQSGADGLERLLPGWESEEQTTFHIVFPAAHHMPVRVRRLIDYLQAQFR
ncbi:LysR substrate-binding domain-containing protein [Halopseudomonas pachastrellae]|nr:LysR substrate-binding domain-containing protein [Halopseudomonas pachastrellae]WVM92232.1 LysR substrate-binding domain-containing protein [Halopseudomonas pachastrellae]